MFGITAGYHRYFAHRTYKTSRAFQFALACLAHVGAKRRAVVGRQSPHPPPPLRHRARHPLAQPSRLPLRPCRLDLGTVPRCDRLALVPDLAKFPELVWLDRHHYLTAALLAVASWLLAAGPAWSWASSGARCPLARDLLHQLAGPCAGPPALRHWRRLRNNWWLAVFTLGEGWHNNHHAFQASARQGFRWWQFDPTWYALTALSWLGLVWDLDRPPASLVRDEQRLGRRAIDKAAQQLAAFFPTDPIAAQAHEVLAVSHRWRDFRARALVARGHAETFLSELHLPRMPSMEQTAASARGGSHARPRLTRSPAAPARSCSRQAPSALAR